jgi:hypothetical protein
MSNDFIFGQFIAYIPVKHTQHSHMRNGLLERIRMSAGQREQLIATIRRENCVHTNTSNDQQLPLKTTVLETYILCVVSS